MTGHTPGTLRLLMAEPRNLAAADLLRLARMEGSGNRPAGAYRVWLLDRAAIPVVWLGLLFLAVAALHRPGGRDRGYGAMAVLLAAGFAFLLGDGILKAFAERGAMDAATAVAVPLGALYLAGGALLLWRTVRA
jgi:lipopolysaccharide export system permease protein